MIIPSYNKKDVPYVFDFDDKGIPHSYPNTPPGYSAPQIIYNFHYEGFLTGRTLPYTWTVEPPFYILSGKNSPVLTCELMPQLIKQQEPIKTGPRKLTYRDYKFCELNLKLGVWSETLNLYYKQGPLWKIEGNKHPKVGTTETYTLVPQYDQTGNPPKNSTFPNYSFDIKNGKVVKMHGGTPPTGKPMIDVLWYSTGASYLSFYSNWSDEPLKFPNTIGIIVS